MSWKSLVLGVIIGSVFGVGSALIISSSRKVEQEPQTRSDSELYDKRFDDPQLGPEIPLSEVREHIVGSKIDDVYFGTTVFTMLLINPKETMNPYFGIVIYEKSDGTWVARVTK